MEKVRYPNLRYQMVMGNKSVKQLATDIGMHQNTLQNKLIGKTEFTIKEAKKLSVSFEKPIEYLFDEK